MSGAALLEARGVWLRYQDGRRRVEALKGVDLTLGAGEFVGLIGPSGSGKSSLLYVLAGLRRPDEGHVLLRGHPLPADSGARADLRFRHLGFLFQEPFLVPYLSVRENALVRRDDSATQARVAALAGAMGLADLLEERPHRLSGGERQRAGLLRALADAPGLILADEPTAALDEATGRQVMEALRAHAREAGLLVVTHDLRMLAGADRVLRLADGRLLPA